MMNKKLKLYSIAKYASYEILVEEQIESASIYFSQSPGNYLKSQRNLKIRILLSKVFGSIIFGIIPIVPIISLFGFIKDLQSNLLNAEAALFMITFLFTILFSLQFINFFILGMINISLIISGNIFQWFRTLPFSSKKLRKLVFFTIFRSMDIPIIIILIAFPSVLLIGTQSFLTFLIGIGVIILNLIFTLSLLVICAERLNRSLDINQIASKKTFFIRLLDTMIYALIIIGSVFLIQWLSNSINEIYRFFLFSESSLIFNLFFGLVPFPFSPSYVISFFMISVEINIFLLINILIGFTLFIIITIFCVRKSFNTIEGIISNKFKSVKHFNPLKVITDKNQIKVKVSKPFRALLYKDFITFTRDIKIFMSMIMPIIVSFVFVITYNFSLVSSEYPFLIRLFIDWLMILAFQPLLAGIIVFSLLNIEESGRSLIASLPITPRTRANAKFLLLFIIQTISFISPGFLYLNSSKFVYILTVILFSLPFTWIFLYLTFELKVFFFGRLKTKYVIEDVNPKNTSFKKILVILINYIIYFWIVSTSITLFLFLSIWYFLLFLFLFYIIVLYILIIIYYTMFPSHKEKYYKGVYDNVIEDLLIINDFGDLLYHWYPKFNVEKKKRELFSILLTEIKNFSTIGRGENIKSFKLRETLIIFEKSKGYTQNLTFIITTKNEFLIELLHSILHEVKNQFLKVFNESLNTVFDGEISRFKEFNKVFEEIRASYGLDVLDESIKQINEKVKLNLIIFIEPKSSSILYSYSRQFIEKGKLSLLIPLILNSSHLLYHQNLNEKVNWIFINTIRNQNLLVESRNKIIIIKQFQLKNNFEDHYLYLEFFRNKEKYLKKPAKISDRFKNLNWNSNIKQIHLVDQLGKIFYSRIFDHTYDFSSYIPETINFFTLAKKIDVNIYNQTLFNAIISGERTVTICMNFNNFALIIIVDMKDLNDWRSLHEISINIYKQLCNL